MRYAMLGSLLLGALPMTASAGHIRIGIGLPVPSISIGGWHHNHWYRPYCYGPSFYPSVYVGPTVYAPPVYYSPAPTVVYTQPQPAVQYYTAPQTYAAPQQQFAPAPQYQYAPAPQQQQQYYAVPQPAQ